MRTNIVLDDALVKEAFTFTKVVTKKELINLAIQEFVNNHRRSKLLLLRGNVKIHSDYDYKKLRSEHD